MYGYTSFFFHHVFKGEKYWWLFVCLPWRWSLLKMGSRLMGRIYMNFIWEATMIMTELLPLKVYLHLNESCCIFSTDLFFPLYILYCSHVWFHWVSMTWHSNFWVISVNLMWIRISTKEFLKSHHTDRQPFVLKFIVSPVKQKWDICIAFPAASLSRRRRRRKLFILGHFLGNYKG